MPCRPDCVPLGRVRSTCTKQSPTHQTGWTASQRTCLAQCKHPDNKPVRSATTQDALGQRHWANVTGPTSLGVTRVNQLPESPQTTHNDGHYGVHRDDRRWSRTVRGLRSLCTPSGGKQSSQNHLPFRALLRLFHRYGCESLHEDLQRRSCHHQFARSERYVRWYRSPTAKPCLNTLLQSSP